MKKSILILSMILFAMAFGMCRSLAAPARWAVWDAPQKAEKETPRGVLHMGTQMPLLEMKTEEASVQYIAYLTFDDGPSGNTLLLLDKLDELSVKATFFVVGNRISKYPKSTNEILRRGHSLGVHSYTHEYSKIYVSTKAFIEDLETAEQAMPKGYQKIYRFPGGINRAKKNASKLADVLKERGYTYYEWNAEIGDGLTRKPSVASLQSHWNKKYPPKTKPKRLVILLHDMAGKRASIAFLDKLVPQLTKDGYIFDTLP